MGSGMSAPKDDLQRWLGWGETASDVATAAPVAGLNALLDHEAPAPRPGDRVPTGWHWLYFLETARQAELAADGLAGRGRTTLPLPLPRRMFGGARLRFHAPLRIGEEIGCETDVVGITPKSGRSGQLVFVTIRQRTTGAAGLAVEEEQDIVYREETTGGTGSPPSGPAPEWTGDWRRVFEPDPVKLFRFSALQFNSHRIHYDRPYATEVEGYPGLVVHGPLIALLLLEACKEECGGRPIAAFRFRAIAPLFDTAPFMLTGRMAGDGTGCDLAALTPDNAVAMSATVDFA